MTTELAYGVSVMIVGMAFLAAGAIRMHQACKEYKIINQCLKDELHEMKLKLDEHADINRDTSSTPGE
jgi:hypothetical protein